ncbi:MAG: hypothetical protein IKV29_03600 [Alistipes sp.]|nr:hypothetical protein [Alistipes sp.]
MKSYKTLLFALVAVVMQFAVACNSDEPQPAPAPEPPVEQLPQPLTESHTLTIFMQGNNGLAEFMDSNLQRILASYYNMPEGDFRIFVFYDRGNYTRLTELYMNDGMAKQRLVEEYDTSFSTVDPDFVKSVLAQVKAEAPADSYGLILSSHGGGWVPSLLYDEYLFKSDSRSEAPAAQPLFYGQDDYDCMEIPDLVAAISDTHYDYIIFDACFMGNVEALYDLRNSADYIVASAAEVLGAGFPYEIMIPMLFEYDDHSLRAICEEYMEYYKNSSGTVALVDCSELEPLAEAMRAVMAEMGELDANAVQAYDAFDYHLYFDLLHYVELGVENSSAFEKALREAVLFAGHTETIMTSTGDVDSFELSRSCGLSCYIPQEACPATEAAWRETAWAKVILE